MKVVISLVMGLILSFIGAFVIQYGYNNIFAEIYDVNTLRYIEVFALMSFISVIRLPFNQVEDSQIERDIFKDIQVHFVKSLFMYILAFATLFILQSII